MKFSSTKHLARKLKNTVYQLCLPMGRMVGTEGHELARRYLLEQLKDVGCEPYQGSTFDLPYQVDGVKFHNLVGVVPGRDRQLPPVLIGAHYDSIIPAPCADDNGAAVAICLSIADDVATAGGLDRDLIVAIFDAEEPPYFQSESMGSIRFYADQLDARGVHFALIYDLVGHDVSVPAEWLPVVKKIPKIAGRDVGVPFLKSALFMTGAESSPQLAGLVDTAGSPDGIKLIATSNEYVGDMSDHGVFRRHGIPYLFFSCGRWAHYHQVTDTPDRLNYQKMARIAELTRNILEQVAGSELGQPGVDDHTLDYEISSLKSAFGMMFPLLLRYAGLRKLETRKDLDQIVDAMMRAGL